MPKKSTELLLRCTDLNKSFPTTHGQTEVLKGVCFTVHSSTVNLITGPSGAGKTTLLGLIAGLERPDTGQIIFRDRAIQAWSNEQLAAWRRRSIGIVFQNFNLIPTFTALENILIAMMHTQISKRERLVRAEAILQHLGILSVRNGRSAELSEGQQQRVAVARSLINSPDLILADEPTAQLDRKTANSLIELIREEVRHRGATLIVATHGLFPKRGADQILHLQQGRIR